MSDHSIPHPNTKHGMRHDPVYAVWHSMNQRCTNSRHRQYKDYGGRGIKVCDRWRWSFADFYADMGPRPSGSSLDRIDNNGHYEPGNCRWATPRQQSANMRTNVRITHNGETLILQEWARRVGIHFDTLWRRLNVYGWSIEDTLTRPAQIRRPRPKSSV